MPGLLARDLGTEISGCCSSTVWTLTTEQGLTVAQAVLPDSQVLGSQICTTILSGTLFSSNHLCSSLHAW